MNLNYVTKVNKLKLIKMKIIDCKNNTLNLFIIIKYKYKRN